MVRIFDDSILLTLTLNKFDLIDELDKSNIP